MRLNFFSQNQVPEPDASNAEVPTPAMVKPPTGRTFPADEVVWGIVIRNGFDELDDPWYHRGTTQHAYLEGNDNVAICGFRPPQSGPRTRRRSRLGMPTAGEHPMCGSCARMVVAPRPRVPVPVQGSRPPVSVPVARPAVAPVPAIPASRPAVAQPVAAPAPTAPPAAVAPPPVAPPPVAPPPVAPPPVAPPPVAPPPVAPPPVAPPPVAPPPVAPPPPPAAPQAATDPTSPWVRQRSGIDEETNDTISIEIGTTHDSGLLRRGVHADSKED